MVGKKPKYYSREESKQEIRRFKRSDFLGLVALCGSDAMDRSPLDWKETALMPWNLVDMADIAIRCSNEHRSTELSITNIQKISRMMFFCSENGYGKGQEGQMSTLTALAYLQYPYETNTALVDGMRLIALFDSLDQVNTQVIKKDEDVEKIFGASTRDAFIGLTILHAMFSSGGGKVDEWVFEDQSAYIPAISSLIDPDVIHALLNRLSLSVDEYKDETKNAEEVEGAIFAGTRYIPLHAAPLLKTDGYYIAPVSGLILKTLAPYNVFYRGIDTLGKGYSGDVGLLFEIYVGKQLSEIPYTTRYSEIKFRGSRGVEASVDWFLETESYLYLIEVKSSTIPLKAKAGTSEYGEKVNEVLTYAAGQIEKTAELVASRKEGFRSLPDKKFRGMIVALDEYHFTDYSYSKKISTLSDDSVAKICISIDVFERLVGYSQKDNIEDILEKLYDVNLHEGLPSDHVKHINPLSNPILKKCSEDFEKRQQQLNKLIESFPDED